jgi:hypothetical protein
VAIRASFVLSSDLSKKLKNVNSYNILKALTLVAGLFISLALWNGMFPPKLLVAKLTPRLLWNTKVHYVVYMRPLLDCILI